MSVNNYYSNQQKLTPPNCRQLTFNHTFCLWAVYHYTVRSGFSLRIIIGLDRQPETKQGIEGKIVRFRSGRVSDKDRRSEPMNFGAC